MSTDQCVPINTLYCPHEEVFVDGHCQDPKTLCSNDEVYDFKKHKCVSTNGCASGMVKKPDGYTRKNLDETTHCSLLGSDKGKFADCYDCALGYGNPKGGSDTYCCGIHDYFHPSGSPCKVLDKRSWP